MTGGVDPLVRVTVARGDGDEFPALTRRSGSRIELLPDDRDLPRLDVGEELGLKRPVAHDAMYEEPVVVIGRQGTGGAVLLEPAGERRRHQQREYVRTSAFDLRMGLQEVVTDVDDANADESAGPRALDATVVDISAGGARIEHQGEPLPGGTLWQVTTELDFEDGSRLPVDVVAEVRWAYDPDAAASAFADEAPAPDATDDDEDATEDPGRAVAGLRFVATPPGMESSITRWVFQQQAKWLRVRREGR